MAEAYVVGHIRVKDAAKWAEYRAQVPGTLSPWGAELVFRGRLEEVLGGSFDHPDAVVIRFPDMASVQGWFRSPAYQALVPLREQAAEVVLLAYGVPPA